MSELKPYQDKQTLKELYVDEGMSVRSVANELDCSQYYVRKWMDKHGIEPRDSGGEPKDAVYKNKEWLIQKYHNESKTLEELAEICSVCDETIYYYMEKFDIQRRDNTVIMKPLNLKTTKRGYEIFQPKEGRIIHHRLLAVAEYGFEAVKGKEVHHKNGIPWDNRPENIDLLAKEDHQRLHILEQKIWDYDRN